MVLKFRVCLIVFWQDSLYLALIVLVLVDVLGAWRCGGGER